MNELNSINEMEFEKLVSEQKSLQEDAGQIGQWAENMPKKIDPNGELFSYMYDNKLISMEDGQAWGLWYDTHGFWITDTDEYEKYMNEDGGEPYSDNHYRPHWIKKIDLMTGDAHESDMVDYNEVYKSIDAENMVPFWSAFLEAEEM